MVELIKADRHYATHDEEPLKSLIFRDHKPLNVCYFSNKSSLHLLTVLSLHNI